MTDPRMTPTNDAPVTVEQCDRERAADAVLQIRGTKDGNWQKRIRHGECDDGVMCQSFARHRLAALASAPAGDGVSLTAQLAYIKNAARYVPVGDGAYDPYGSAAEAVDAAVDRLAAALARPREAVGEQSREAIWSVLDDAIDNAGDESELRMAKAIRHEILALQPPPAKVE